MLLRNTRPAAIALTAIILFAAAIRIRLLDIPLERDEGEYAYAGQLLLHGIPPDKVAWNMKFPGTYTAYAAIMSVLRETTQAIHLGLLLVNAATTVLLYLLARRWFDARAAVAAAGTFALLSMGAGVLGLAGHATHFVILFAVAGTLALFGSRPRVFLSGLLFGMAVVMKQQGLVLGLFGGAWLIWSLARTQGARAQAARRLTAFALGAALPLALTFLILWKAGVFERFWFWTFRYAREYATEMTLRGGWTLFCAMFPRVVLPNIALWVAAAAGLVLLWWKHNRLRTALPVTLFLVFSVLAVCPGLYFREHYFIPMLPAVALLTGSAVDSGNGRDAGFSRAVDLGRRHGCVWLFPAGASRVEHQVRHIYGRMSQGDGQYGDHLLCESIHVHHFELNTGTDPPVERSTENLAAEAVSELGAGGRSHLNAQEPPLRMFDTPMADRRVQRRL